MFEIHAKEPCLTDPNQTVPILGELKAEESLNALIVLTLPRIPFGDRHCFITAPNHSSLHLNQLEDLLSPLLEVIRSHVGLEENN